MLTINWLNLITASNNLNGFSVIFKEISDLSEDQRNIIAKTKQNENCVCTTCNYDYMNNGITGMTKKIIRNLKNVVIIDQISYMIDIYPIKNPIKRSFKICYPCAVKITDEIKELLNMEICTFKLNNNNIYTFSKNNKIKKHYDGVVCFIIEDNEVVFGNLNRFNLNNKTGLIKNDKSVFTPIKIDGKSPLIFPKYELKDFETIKKYYNLTDIKIHSGTLEPLEKYLKNFRNEIVEMKYFTKHERQKEEKIKKITKKKLEDYASILLYFCIFIVLISTFLVKVKLRKKLIETFKSISKRKHQLEDENDYMKCGEIV
ncbi:hypothetical protein HERIO_715 [Hepatospora eriocheir]|uniref:Uncharacterized protein n=1 Tax=Hepatospora eriocheir TaxID=1081669 RepID=A0A1X0QCL5_9MICR|nr:hypothetical protein HERIO_715 [Hepatospora eriocheir]